LKFVICTGDNLIEKNFWQIYSALTDIKSNLFNRPEKARFFEDARIKDSGLNC